ncbi:MAG TPA: outer membrane beta-barrel protein [Gemmatimonadales bacterium]|nr:outer membrane beta-barrel protein [Gemmatimonadales bacterium]
MRTYSIAAALLLAATPLAAQNREIILSVYGGGADHLADVEESATAWFMPGYTLGASIGYPLNRTFAIHGDFTYTRNPVDGSGPLAAGDVNRFFYGVHAEYRYPWQQWAPFVFGGLGAVSIDQLGADESFDPTTRPAAMIGGGVFYAIPGSRLEITGEVKGLIYNWNMAGYDRNMFDVTYTAGFAYRLPL